MKKGEKAFRPPCTPAPPCCIRIRRKLHKKRGKGLKNASFRVINSKNSRVILPASLLKYPGFYTYINLKMFIHLLIHSYTYYMKWGHLTCAY